MKSNQKMVTLNFSFREGLSPTLDSKSTVIALGTFDGVHVAHRRLIEEACSLKSRVRADLVGVWCFEESPSSIIHGTPGPLLTTQQERIRLLTEGGADFVVMGSFRELRNTPALDFINEILVARLGCVATVCGFNHKFGQSGTGNSLLLEEFFGKDNTVTVSEIKVRGETVSSSAIREHLMQGEIDIAREMLGRPIAFTAPVSEGKKLGRRIGFPTANQIFPKNFVQLKNGVYSTRCIFPDGECFMGVSNVGIRPSIELGDDHKINCETYIIDFSNEVYGKDLKIEFHKYLREEKKFSSLEELSRAIENDRENTVKYFSEDKK